MLFPEGIEMWQKLFALIFITAFITSAGAAPVINPSVESESYWCRIWITGWICDMTGGGDGGAVSITNNYPVANDGTLINIYNVTSTFLNNTADIINIYAGGMNQTPNMTAGPRGIQGIQGIPGLNNMTPGYTPIFGVDYFNGSDGYTPIFGVDYFNGTSTTVAINYTFTGLPGTEANITNVGNSTDALWDVTIPRGVTGDAGTTGATGGTGGQILYFRNSASTDPITYEGLILVPKGVIEVDENVTVNSNRVLVDSYITDIGYPGVTEYPAGLWRFRTYNYVSAFVGDTNAVFEVYNRTSAGTETLLFTVVSEDINALATAEYLTSYVQTTAYPVSLADRIVVKVYGQADHTSNIIFHWVYEGSTHTSHIQTTLQSAPATSLSFGVIAGETLYKGQAVYISGASGGNPVVMRADNLATASSRVVGIMADNTANGARGIVRRSGVLTSVDTRTTNTNINPNGETWLAGDLLFSTSTGGLTKVRPTSGRSVKVAYSLFGSSEADVLLAYPMENPVWVTAAANEGIVLRLGDNAGATNVSIRNYLNTQVASINSDGSVNMTGNLDLGSKQITSLITGLTGDAATNKSYVDSKSSTFTLCSNLSMIYPINVVMITTNNVSPATSLGCGNWSSLGTGYALVGI